MKNSLSPSSVQATILRDKGENSRTLRQKILKAAYIGIFVGGSVSPVGYIAYKQTKELREILAQNKQKKVDGERAINSIQLQPNGDGFVAIDAKGYILEAMEKRGYVHVTRHELPNGKIFQIFQTQKQYHQQLKDQIDRFSPAEQAKLKRFVANLK